MTEANLLSSFIQLEGGEENLAPDMLDMDVEEEKKKRSLVSVLPKSPLRSPKPLLFKVNKNINEVSEDEISHI